MRKPSLEILIDGQDAIVDSFATAPCEHFICLPGQTTDSFQSSLIPSSSLLCVFDVRALPHDETATALLSLESSVINSKFKAILVRIRAHQAPQLLERVGMLKQVKKTHAIDRQGGLDAARETIKSMATFLEKTPGELVGRAKPRLIVRDGARQWSGRGKMPAWVPEELVTQTSMLIDGQSDPLLIAKAISNQFGGTTTSITWPIQVQLTPRVKISVDCLADGTRTVVVRQ